MSQTAEQALEHLTEGAIVPVVVIDDAGAAPEVAAALCLGGIWCAEITLRTDAGIAAIAAMASIPNFLVGAGTVLSPADVDACVDAGAGFVVSPGLDEAVVRRAQDRGIAVLPGIATATEAQRAVSLGLRAVKLFPAELLGGTSLINALVAPFPDLRFMPSGGITEANFRTYLAHPAVFAIGGSWMATRELIRRRDFERIAALSRAASSG